MTINEIDLLLLNLLNLKPKDIDSLSSCNTDSGKEIHVRLSKPKIRVCPVCGCIRGTSKGFYKKNLMISNETFHNMKVVLDIPRLRCPDCGKSFSDNHYMSPEGYSVSYEVIQRIMNLLRNPEITFTRCADLTGVSETTVTRVFDRNCHVQRGRFPEAVCIDEVYTKVNDFKINSTTYSKYSCVFYDFYQHTLIDVAPARTKDYLISYFSSIEVSERQGVKFVVIDMYRTYRDLVKTYFKRAVICVDSFHVIKHLNDSLSKLRIRIMKCYDPDSKEYYLLKSWNNLLFDRNRDYNNKGKYNKKMGCVMNYGQLRQAILDIDPQLDKAWHLKELYTEFNATCDYEHAEERIHEILQEFFKADIPEYRQFAAMVLEWKPYIVNSFMTYKGRRLNNSVAESLNVKFGVLLYNTRGMRNSERRRKRILYAINKTGFTIK